MFLKKAITLLAIAAQLCYSLDIKPIAKYEGLHSQKCYKASQLTGTRVNDKIYTFGGCYPIPYLVDLENDMNPFGFSSQSGKFNTTDTVYSYDIKQDIWTLESHTPMLVNGAQLQVVGTDIYLFDIHAEPDHHRSRIWKYATTTKEWQSLEELPFIWRYQLLSCEHDSVIYFTGKYDGELRNIIQRYNTHEDQWLKPLFLDSYLQIHHMLCAGDGIQILGNKFHKDQENEMWASMIHGEPQITQSELYHTSSYDDGKVVESELNVSMTFQAPIFSSGDSFYILDVFNENTTITKVDTKENKAMTLGSLDKTIKDALFVHYNEKEAFLIGGGQDNGGIMMMMPRKKQQDKEDALKTYNHRLKLIEEEVTHTAIDEEQSVIKNVE